MLNILSRRLRLRDDGTGKSRETECTFKEFGNEGAIVLLGDPGMGKTTFFKEASKGNYNSVRKFLVNPNVDLGDLGEALYLDALDEYKTIQNGHGVVDAVVSKLLELKKPNFRLSCRSADWIEADQEMLSLASPTGRIVVLELLPLTEDEIKEAVQGVISDPDNFLNEIKLVGIDKLLGNPQTLELVAQAWGTDKRPENKFQAYEIGVSGLLKETNAQHSRIGSYKFSAEELIDVAEYICTIVLLSNSVGVSRTDVLIDEGYIRLPAIPVANRSCIDSVLGRRLFSSPKTDLFESVHRTIEEFLAAKNLSKRIRSNSLPMERVISLICGVDGRPVSSLKGLFGWLMCMLGELALPYVGRDPYAVVAYGDATVLPPSVQCEIWDAFHKYEDPWFLEKQEYTGLFGGLANLNTAHKICQLLQDPTTSVHLKIAIFDAVVNSNEVIGLEVILKKEILNNHDNVWLRSSALRAYAATVQYNRERLKKLDHDLMQATKDPAASQVRVELLLLTKSFGDVASRMLSIMEQAALQKDRTSVYGYYCSLFDLPADNDLDNILDDAARVLKPGGDNYLELKRLFQGWFGRRLEDMRTIASARLANWLQYIEIKSDRTQLLLKRRFEKEPSLFIKVIKLLFGAVLSGKQDLRLFLHLNLRKSLPGPVWPMPQSELFLSFAEGAKDPKRGADFFDAYLSFFPLENAPGSLAQAGFALLDCRPDIAEELGNWHYCEIDSWRKEQWSWDSDKKLKHTERRTLNIKHLTPRLSTIMAGTEERLLEWAAPFYVGFGKEEIPDAYERLVYETNEEIATAFVEGFVNYLENPDVPSLEEIIKCYVKGRFYGRHILFNLSIFLRIAKGLSIPEAILPQSIASAITFFYVSEIADYNETLSCWVFRIISRNQNMAKSVLLEIWTHGLIEGKSSLPFFQELVGNTDNQQFLTELIAELLRKGIINEPQILKQFLTVFLYHNRQVILTVGEKEFFRSGLSAEVRAVWITALYIVEPNLYLDCWRKSVSTTDSATWEAIELIGSRYQGRTVQLTPAQQAEIIILIGKRFPNVSFPTGGFCGSRNPWDASMFVRNQINMLVNSSSSETDDLFLKLVNETGLASYRDWIRHHRAQYRRKLREYSFAFASPEQVAAFIQNLAPATVGDLLSFIIDHLTDLSNEMARTQKEKYRAYWSHNGLNITKPKYETICSKILAEDIQNRVRAQHLIVTVEHHMVGAKKCDIVVLYEEMLLPIEVKHHFHRELWRAWDNQLNLLYTKELGAGGLGIYLILWSGEAEDRKMPKPPDGVERPTTASELKSALESLIPQKDRQRIRVVVVDISGS